jgi:hypothetical protein
MKKRNIDSDSGSSIEEIKLEPGVEKEIVLDDEPQECVMISDGVYAYKKVNK